MTLDLGKFQLCSSLQSTVLNTTHWFSYYIDTKEQALFLFPLHRYIK